MSRNAANAQIRANDTEMDRLRREVTQLQAQLANEKRRRVAAEQALTRYEPEVLRAARIAATEG